MAPSSPTSSPPPDPRPDGCLPGPVLDSVEWVFGYGSLMWRPGFDHLETAPATLEGFHRAFCILSQYYRGTPHRPGLVLGLDRGGSCTGLAFRFATHKRRDVIDYLNERELTGYAYRPAVVDIDISGRRVAAYTFIADPDHSLYAGAMNEDASAQLIMNAEGVSGLNRDYLINTIKRLEQLGFRDDTLHRLLTRIEYLTGIIDQGSGI